MSTKCIKNIEKIDGIDSLEYIQETNEIAYGKLLTQIVEILNKHLPLYIIFKPNVIKYYKKNRCRRKRYTYKKNKWKYITNLINCDPNDCSNCLKFFETKNKFMDAYNLLLEPLSILIKDLIKKNIQIIFQGNEIDDYIIYKKLQVKFDFLYIPLDIYNYIRANIELKKMIQILELLGPKKINISVKNEIKTHSENTMSVSADVLGVELLNNVMKSESKKMKQKTTYSLKPGFFFSIDNLIEYISNIKHIFMSKNDYEKDFDLRYLIRSRIESYLNTYSRILYVKKLSSIETKLQSSLKDVYIKLDLEYKRCFQSIQESIVTINCDFYNVEELSIVKDLPPNEKGFLILSKKFINTDNKETNNFNDNIKILIEKIMTKYKIKHIHNKIINNSANVQDIINIASEDIERYKTIYNSVKSYNDIQTLVDYILTDANFVPLNNKGFLLIKSKGEDEYLYDIRIYFRRVLEKYNIEKAYDSLNDFFMVDECNEEINDSERQKSYSHQPLNSIQEPFSPRMSYSPGISSSNIEPSNIKLNRRSLGSFNNIPGSFLPIKDNLFDNYNLIERQNTLFKTFDSFKDIIKYINKFLNDPYKTSVNRCGFETLQKCGKFDKTNKHVIKNIRVFLTRFIHKHSIDIKFLDIYDKLLFEQQLSIFTNYNNLKLIQKEPNYYKKLTDIVIKNDSKMYIMESKVIEKKYRKDIVKNKKRLNIKKEIIKLDISTFNKIDINNSNKLREHLIINKDIDLTVPNTSFDSNKFISRPVPENKLNNLKLKHVKINPIPTDLNSICSDNNKNILLSKKDLPNIILMTDL